MEFSSGDMIALFVGSIGAIRWIADKLFNKTESDDERFLRLELDYERFKAARVVMDQNNADTLRRIERGLSDVQSQLRMAVTGGANKFMEVITDDHKDKD